MLAPTCSAALYRPKRIVLACGDGSNYLAKLRWSRWTAATATGTGVNVIDDCKPDCVSGHLHSYPVAVALSKPMRCKKRRHKVFGRIDLAFGNTHPGPGRTTSGPLFCPLGS